MGRTTTEASGRHAHRPSLTSWTIASVARAHAFAAHLSAKHIEAVNYVQHGVAVYVVILCVAALHSVYGATEVAQVVENVVELQHHRQWLSA